jgi:aspartyl-tRNA(Asn)/glutamyl-tRNA(Gln) amidotransferase subunit A
VALAEARAAERDLMAGRRRGPMHGIPYALKDIVETAGIPTTGHSTEARAA